MKRTLRTFTADDVAFVTDYFLNAGDDYLMTLGVDRKKLPAHDAWHSMVADDFTRPVEEREFYYLLWENDGTPVGHSNLNKIIWAQEAYMHLHLWNPEHRGGGHGTFFLKESVSDYFSNFYLNTLISEPNALNPGPNKILQKIGFELVQTYETIPGWINFRQTVNRWVLTRDRWLQFS